MGWHPPIAGTSAAAQMWEAYARLLACPPAADAAAAAAPPAPRHQAPRRWGRRRLAAADRGLPWGKDGDRGRHAAAGRSRPVDAGPAPVVDVDLTHWGR